MLKKLKESVDIKKLKESVDGVKNQAGDLKGYVEGKIREYTTELNELIPSINAMGYEIKEIEIEVGISPKLIPHFAKVKDVSEEITQSELDKYKDKKLSIFILSSLVKASSMRDIINIGTLKFTEVELELSVIPAVKMKFLPHKSFSL